MTLGGITCLLVRDQEQFRRGRSKGHVKLYDTIPAVLHELGHGQGGKGSIVPPLEFCLTIWATLMMLNPPHSVPCFCWRAPYCHWTWRELRSHLTLVRVRWSLRRTGFANCHQAHDASRCATSGLIAYADVRERGVWEGNIRAPANLL